MTSSTSEKNKRRGPDRAVWCWLAVTLFCLLFSRIYLSRSHGVVSEDMLWLWLWPLALGLLPAVLLWLIRRLPRVRTLCANLYRPGVAALTVAAALRGVIHIAGSSSPYPGYLSIAGWILLAAGAVSYLLRR